MSKYKNTQRQFLIAGCLNIAQIMTGYTVAWSSPVIPKLEDLTQSPLPYEISLSQASWVGSSVNIGIIIGPYVAGFLANLLGRKKCLILGSLIMIIGHLIVTLAKNLATIYVGRIVSGFAVGTLIVVNIIYIGEMSSTHVRGIILTSTGVFHALGSLVVNAVGPYVSYHVIGYVLFTIAAFHLLGCMYIPESPAYLILKGQEDASIAVMKFLGRGKETEEIKNMMENKKQSEEQEWKFHELFTVKANRKSLFITFPVFLFQQCCGLLAILYFTNTIFANAGVADPAMATIITVSTQFIGALIVPTVIERAGRKTLLLISTAGCFVSMLVMGVYFYLDFINHSSVENLRWLPVVTLVVSFIAFSIGLNIVPNALLGEMFRPNIRSIGSSLVMTIGNFMGFVTITSFGYIVASLGSHVVFWMFTVVNLVGFIFVLFVVPETKGLSLAEIENLLSN